VQRACWWGMQIVCGVTQLFECGAALSEYAGPRGGGVLRGVRVCPVGQLAADRAAVDWAEPERYVRGILANASADRWRRLARRAERPLPARGEDPALPDHSAAVADRDYLLRALAALPPRQRAVLVLRYFDDLSEAETAQMLGCSLGTVKSQAARAWPGCAAPPDRRQPADRRPPREVGADD